MKNVVPDSHFICQNKGILIILKPIMTGIMSLIPTFRG